MGAGPELLHLVVHPAEAEEEAHSGGRVGRGAGACPGRSAGPGAAARRWGPARSRPAPPANGGAGGAQPLSARPASPEVRSAFWGVKFGRERGISLGTQAGEGGAEERGVGSAGCSVCRPGCI